MEELDLRSLLMIIRKRWWIAVLVTILSVAAAVVLSFFVMEPVYQSDTTLYVGSNKEVNTTITTSDIMLNSQLVNDYRELVKSRFVSSQVIEELGLTGISPGALSRMLDVSSVKDTRFIMISAQHRDPEMAMLIAQKVADVFKVKVIEVMKIENVQTIDTALLPFSPIKPNKPMNIAVSCIIGLMLGFGLILLIEYLDNTIKTPEDVLKYTGIPVIGTIPISSDSLLAYSLPKSPVTEAYRVLRTNIQFSGVDKILRTLVITSSGPAEGKTTTLGNLAITFAQAGSRVLIVDADMRKPNVHRLFELANEAGLTNVLAMREDFRKYTRRTEVENLDILPSGPIPPNPSELLSSNRMKQFMEEVQADYDIIFVDAPPVGVVTDAAVLSTIVDGTILVAASAQVNINALQRSQELLKKVKSNIIGVVVNMIDKVTSKSYYYYYNDYYYSDEN